MRVHACMGEICVSMWVCEHVSLLCKYSVIIQESMTALMWATQRGHKVIVKELVERKANPNITADKVGLCLLCGS